MKIEKWFNELSENNLDHIVFVEKQHHCALCGSELKIHVKSYLENYTVQEEAECEKCQLKTRVKDHRMH
ncbi:MAG: hypothetical protein CL675_13625 [Bdellovibrionaceae bacterium]|nr:hypothetical protein [Pseudobdellovibrionaceae bacterium]